MTSLPRSPLALAFLCLATGLAHGQSTPSSQPMPDAGRLSRTQRNELLQTAPLTSFPLHYTTTANDANEILTGLRLMLDPAVKLYLVDRDNTILMRGLPDDVAFATRLIGELDRPRTSYRLTFTVAQYDGPHRLQSNDYTMTVLDGQRATMRQGIRVPVQTEHSDGPAGSEGRTTYVDVGLNFDATVSSNETGATLREKVEQSSLVDPQNPGAAPAATPPGGNPVIHQTVMEATTNLPLGRVTPLGTLDAQGSTRRTQVEVRLEKLP